MPVHGLVVGKHSARESLTFHEANVPAFLVGELQCKVLFSKMSGAVGQTMSKSVVEYRPHASSGALDAGLIVFALGAPPSDGEIRGAS